MICRAKYASFEAVYMYTTIKYYIKITIHPLLMMHGEALIPPALSNGTSGIPNNIHQPISQILAFVQCNVIHFH